jgi:2-polyprenyl-6-methoxyphenol hydroxylase-like FAD-dependent oxidoreductase
MCAIELARYGVRPRIFDQLPEAHRQARASTIHPGAMYGLAKSGLMDVFESSAVKVASKNLYGADLRLLESDDLTRSASPFPFVLAQQQWRTEDHLRRRLSTLGVEVEWSSRVTAFDPRIDRTIVTIESPSGTESTSYRHVIGAGGAHCPLRNVLGEQLEGGEYTRIFAVLEVQCRMPVYRAELFLTRTPAGSLVIIPLPPDSTLLFIDLNADHPHAAAHENQLGTADAIALVQERIGSDLGIESVLWSSVFTQHHRIAPMLTDGRRHLVGDAAHLETAFAGMGMNSGFMDAANLSWKLALELQGTAYGGLISTYDIERRAANEQSIGISDDVYHAMVDGLILPEVPGVDRLDATLMLDVCYPGPLAQERVPGGRAAGGASAQLQAGRLFPDPYLHSGTRFMVCASKASPHADQLLARWGELLALADPVPECLPRDCVALVRPDGFIAFLGIPADEAAFAAIEVMLASWLRLDGTVNSGR